MTKHEQRVINFTHAVQGTHERYHSIDIVTYQNSRGLPCVAIWTHSTKKPSYNYSFKDEQQRENYINGKKEYELITFQSRARYSPFESGEGRSSGETLPPLSALCMG
jgi:hypothetical protein